MTLSVFHSGLHGIFATHFKMKSNRNENEKEKQKQKQKQNQLTTC